MKDSSAEASRDELLAEYVRWSLQLRTEPEPCRDHGLLTRARVLLGRDPTADGVFAVLPFHQAVTEVAEPAHWTRHLSAVVKAAELLEMLCVNLFLQPWRKEFKTLKCYTGAFVYHLKPVFSTPTLQLVLARIGYLPDPESSYSQYRLGADVNPEQTMQMGFELMLARAECLHHLELLDSNQLSVEASLDLLQRSTGVQPDRQSEEKSQHQREDGDEDRAEKRRSVPPRAKPRHHGYHLLTTDQSFIEMQKNYPDLAIGGRPILPEKPALPPPYLKKKHQGAAPPARGGSTSNDEDGGGADTVDDRMGPAQWVPGGGRPDQEEKEGDREAEVENKQENEDEDQRYVLL